MKARPSCKLYNETRGFPISRATEVERADMGCDMHTGELEWGRPLAYLVLNSLGFAICKDTVDRSYYPNQAMLTYLHPDCSSQSQHHLT